MPDLDFYDGAYTGAQIDQRLGNMIVVVTGTITSDNRRINNSKILANHVVLYAYIATPRAQAGRWLVDTYAGYLEVTGNITVSTTVTFVLGLQ